MHNFINVSSSRSAIIPLFLNDLARHLDLKISLRRRINIIFILLAARIS